MAILALLARAGERGVSREKILELLWPDAADERGTRTLAQALYALKKDLVAEDAITGSRELCFDPALVTTDIAEFTAAIARGDDTRAVEAYAGTFLDGFHVVGAEAFARWVERERAAIAQDYARALESLARAALARGDAPAAVGWWRRLAALEPLNARITIGLMEALTAAGDRHSAIRQARIYEMLVEQELELPPDKEVVALADRLRVQPDDAPRPAEPEPAVTTAVAPDRPPDDVTSSSADVAPARPDEELVALEPARIEPGGRRAEHAPTRVPAAWTVAALIALVVGVWLIASRTRTGATAIALGDPSTPVVAIGRIASYGTDSSARVLTGPVSDLLATSLARSRGLRVVSAGRILELTHRSSTSADTSAGTFVEAARQAGAAQVIDGTLYARPGGRLRLDLRRVDLATGAIRDVHTIEGDDLFALVDSGTARLVSGLGGGAPEGSIADVTTRSVAAFRMYEEGIDAFFHNDLRAAQRLFDRALSEDSLFALAAYYGALAVTSFGPDSYLPRMSRARRLATRAPDRERLTILADWARRASIPTLRQVAETLAIRYPAEVEGHLYSGIALVNEGEFLAARAPLERVIAMDSLGAHRGVTCGLCIAMEWLVSAYLLADSLPAAERTARRWIRLQPGVPGPVDALVGVLDRQGRAAEAESLVTVARTDLTYDEAIDNRVFRLIRRGDYETADRMLAAQTRRGSVEGQANAYWAWAISLREQGRLDEALEAARRLRPLSHDRWNPGALTSASVIEGLVQLERGQAAVAAALFDSIAQVRPVYVVPSQLARDSAWRLTHAAAAHAAAGDTASLARLADRVFALGAQSGYGRDRRLYHHIRGLLSAARGDDEAAIAEFRAAIYSISAGYTRTNFELARVYLRDQRPRDAIAVLQPALRGSLEAQNLYVNRMELHDLLAHAWDAAGVRDSAAAHYDVVARAWAGGDAPFKARADTARVRAARRS